ncbi:MAG: TonB-dependent receptor plug domain-containing protein, partial [Bacteroidota bacterium]
EIDIQEDTHFDIQLPHSKAHDTVHIHDKHPDPKPTQGESTLTEEELEKLKGKQLGEALREIAGVDALQTGPSIFKPMIHGLHSNRVLVLNNGIRQEGQQWGSEHGPEIDPFIANELTVVKGANGVRYGPDAIAGVVLVEPAPLRDSAGIGGRVDLVGMSNGRMGATSGMLEGNFARLPAFAWRVQGTLKRGGDMHTPDYNLTNTGLREYNFSAAAGWQKERYGVDVFYSQFNTDLGIFAGAHIGNLTDLQLAIERDTPLIANPFSYEIKRPYQHIEHELTKVRSWLETGEAGKLSLTYARQYNLRQEFDTHTLGIAPGTNPPQLHYEITSHLAELVWEHEKWKGLKGQVGVMGQTQKWSGWQTKCNVLVLRALCLLVTPDLVYNPGV